MLADRCKARRRFVKAAYFLITWWLALPLPALAGVVFRDAPPQAGPDQPPVQYWKTTLTEPRPLQIHFVKIDLHAPGHELVVLVGRDPDAGGPVEASLAEPLALAAQYGVLAAVNANFFAWLPEREKEMSVSWKAGEPVDIIGWVASGNRMISPPQRHATSLWVEFGKGARIGRPPPDTAALLAVSGLKQILARGEVQVSAGGMRHPRTAAGLDARGRWLWLTVVDGRKPGSSEGVTLYELARFMLAQGCTDALNLDGGGSSVLVALQEDGTYAVMSRPAGGSLRPVPVMLGVRERPKPRHGTGSFVTGDPGRFAEGPPSGRKAIHAVVP